MFCYVCIDKGEKIIKTKGRNHMKPFMKPPAEAEQHTTSKRERERGRHPVLCERTCCALVFLSSLKTCKTGAEWNRNEGVSPDECAGRQRISFPVAVRERTCHFSTDTRRRVSTLLHRVIQLRRAVHAIHLDMNSLCCM